VAVKQLPLTDLEAIHNEVQLHRKLRHAGIVTFIGCTQYDPEIVEELNINSVYIIMEYMRYGNLSDVSKLPATNRSNFSLVHSMPNLPLNLRVQMSYDIAKAVEYLHT
jgi:serine/threonine protein kinase